MSTVPSAKKYVMDTNTLIGFSIWNPITLNKTFWDCLERALMDGKWVLLDVVVKEITYSGPLKDWCKKQKQRKLVTEISDDDKLSAIEINNNYPMVDMSTFNSEGDTFIVAYALNNGLAIFSREIHKTPTQPLYKIPDVCAKLNIDVTKHPERFLESIGYKA